MKAAMYYGKKDIRIEDVEAPKAEAGEVVIKVKRCGICGTDLHEYAMGFHTIPKDVPNPLTGDKAPIIIGHEFAGDIVEIGEGVDSKWKIGDRVTVVPELWCGKCKFCLQGLQPLCEKFACTGLQWHWGGFAEFCKAKEYQLAKLPDNVTYQQAANADPLMVACYGIRRSGLKLGDTVLVSGGGPVGVLYVMAAKAAGAARIYASEISPIRKEMLLKFGATEVFDPTQCDVAAEVKARTEGMGVDIVIESAGVEASVNTCFEAVKMRGMFVQSAMLPHPITITKPDLWAFKDLNMVGLWCLEVTFLDKLLDLVSNGVFSKVDDIVTKVISLDDLVEEGFEALLKPDGATQLKIQVAFDD